MACRSSWSRPGSRFAPCLDLDRTCEVRTWVGPGSGGPDPDLGQCRCGCGSLNLNPHQTHTRFGRLRVCAAARLAASRLQITIVAATASCSIFYIAAAIAAATYLAAATVDYSRHSDVANDRICIFGKYLLSNSVGLVPHCLPFSTDRNALLLNPNALKNFSEQSSWTAL